MTTTNATKTNIITIPRHANAAVFVLPGFSMMVDLVVVWTYFGVSVVTLEILVLWVVVVVDVEVKVGVVVVGVFVVMAVVFVVIVGFVVVVIGAFVVVIGVFVVVVGVVVVVVVVVVGVVGVFSVSVTIGFMLVVGTTAGGDFDVVVVVELLFGLEVVSLGVKIGTGVVDSLRVDAVIGVVTVELVALWSFIIPWELAVTEATVSVILFGGVLVVVLLDVGDFVLFGGTTSSDTDGSPSVESDQGDKFVATVVPCIAALVVLAGVILYSGVDWVLAEVCSEDALIDELEACSCRLLSSDIVDAVV
jgi:hypothetical protein